jgi:hypothetical protein
MLTRVTDDSLERKDAVSAKIFGEVKMRTVAMMTMTITMMLREIVEHHLQPPPKAQLNLPCQWP